MKLFSFAFYAITMIVGPMLNAQMNVQNPNILPTSTIVGIGDVNAIYGDERTIWPKRSDGATELTVCWEDSENQFSQEKAWTEDAITRSWEMAANIHFIWIGSCSGQVRGSFMSASVGRAANIRISIEDVNPHAKGLGSAINNMKNGVVLNFSFKNFSPTCQNSKEYCIRLIAIHEFGHALGFAHEQNRPDTPASCQDAPQGSNGTTTIGVWDLDSVMNYCNPHWINNGKLSKTDIQGVQTFYGNYIPGFDLSSAMKQYLAKGGVIHAG